MTTASSLTAFPGLAPTLLPDTTANTKPATLAVSPQPSTIVTIPSALGAAAVVYTPQGTLANATAPALTWSQGGSDPVTQTMAANYAYSQSIAGQLNGLGSALLDRFKTTGDDYSQSVSLTSASAASQLVPASTGPQANVALTVKTASGVEVDITLDSGGGTLGANIRSSGPLSDSERTALAKLADGFQKAIDGLDAVPPKLDLSSLMQGDASVLSSVKLQFSVIGDGANDLSATFSTSSTARSLSLSGAVGTLSVNVDMSNAALWGSDAQRSQAIASYLKQIDNATAQGHGNAALTGLFEDAFTQLNSNYGTSSQQLVGTGYAPWLAQADHAMLTGLADFSASMADTPVSSNPLRLDETDAMSYQFSQTTSTAGSLLKGSISQHQQSHLRAAYHQTVTGTGTPKLTTSLLSQSYRYLQISADTDSTMQLATEKGRVLDASLSQSASQSTRQTEYLRGNLVSDVTTPASASQSKDLLALLKPLLENGDAEKNSADWQQTLAGIHGLILQGVALPSTSTATAAV
ncbi:hypothetical protein [Burkholderia sp. 22PA0106]|uniref:hypothetical protein n=1 Tax=Burkholderia sp. 22PA0106 TaxID=3237371 RepID=UPI0039C15067